MFATGIYGAMIRLYPREFRAQYRNDLVQHFTDLVNERGVRAAWTRTAVDLIVTVPRYRLEAIMNDRHSTTTLTVAITLLAAGGLFSVPAGIYPGVVLLPLAGALAVGQRSALARAIRTADSDRRRRRLTTSVVLALAWAVATAIIVIDLRHEEHWGGKVVVYNLIFFATFIGAIVYFVVGLLTPKLATPS